MCCAAACLCDDDRLDMKAIFDVVKDHFAKMGIEFEASCETDGEAGCDGVGKVKVVCVSPDLVQSAREMGESSRDQVVMVRVDTDTAAKLDAWVETGAVKSRSEAAALFIREGLKVRATEIERLDAALKEVHRARERLQREAQEVFGGGDD